MPETVAEFAARIKSKYADYKDVDDYELVSRIANKYPDYRSTIDAFNVEGSEKLAGVSGDTLRHFDGLRSEFAKAGITPIIKSGFRTAAQQNALHKQGYPTKGNDGYKQISPHQEGRALDLGFSPQQKEAGRKIIAAYAAKYGLHVPSDEPWHVAVPSNYTQPKVAGVTELPYETGAGTANGTVSSPVSATAIPMKPRAPQSVGSNDARWHLGISADEWKSMSASQQQRATQVIQKAVAIDQQKKASGQVLNPSLEYINQNRKALGLQPKYLASSGLPVVGEQQQPSSPYDLKPVLRAGLEAERQTEKFTNAQALVEAKKRNISFAGIKRQVEAELSKSEIYQDEHGIRRRMVKPDSAVVVRETMSRVRAAIAEAKRKERVSQVGTAEYLAQYPKGVVTGLAGGAGTLLKGAAVGGKKLVSTVIDTSSVDADESWTYQLGDYITKKSKELVRSNPDLEQEFFVGQAPSAVGQSLTFLLGGAISKAPQVATKILGGTMIAGDAYDEVKSMGGTEEQAINGALIAAGILGPTQVIGMRNALKAIEGTAKATTIKAALAKAAKEGTVDALKNMPQEALEELVQGIATGKGRTPAELLNAAALGGVTPLATTTPLSALRTRIDRSSPTPQNISKPVSVEPLPEIPLTSRTIEAAQTVKSNGNGVGQMESFDDVPLSDEDKLLIDRELSAPKIELSQVQSATDTLLQLGVIDHEQAYQAIKKSQEVVSKPAESANVPRATTATELTSARNADTEADRKELFDLPEFDEVDRKSFQTSLDNAKSKGLHIEALRISTEVTKNPRSLSDEESAGLTLKLAELKNEHKAALASGNSDRINTLEDEFEKVSNALKASGTETARALAARKLTINQDYDLVTLVTRAKAKGIEITPEKRKKYEAISKEVEQVQTELETAKDTAELAGVEKKLKVVKRFKARAQNKAKLDSEYAELKTKFAAEFKKITKGNVQGSLLGSIDPEGNLTRIIIQMFNNRVRAGMNSAVDIIDSLHVELGSFGLSKRDIQTAVSGYGKVKQSDNSEQAVQVRELKRQMALALKIEDAQSGKRPLQSGYKHDPRSAEVERLQKELKDAMKASGLVVPVSPVVGRPRLSDAKKLPMEGPRKSDVRKAGAPAKQGPKLSDANKLKAAGPRLSEAPKQGPTEWVTSAKRSLEKRIAELEEKIATKDFTKKAKKERPITPEILKLQTRLDELKSEYETELHNAQLTTGQRWAKYAFDVAMIPKSVMSSADLSALLRQGGFHSMTHPVISAKAFAASLTGITDLGHAKLKAKIEGHPDYDRAVKAGIEFTGLDKPNSREENYISNLVKNLPVLKQSERQFSGFLDVQRLQVFSKLAQGVTDDKALKALGAFINIASGRGDIKQGGSIAKHLHTANLALYSPRLVVSRFQLLNKILNPVAWKNMPPQVRRQMFVDNVKFVAGVSTMLGMAALAGLKVSFDPEDPDFLKARYGTTRYDLWAGTQQPLRATLRMLKALGDFAQGKEDTATAGNIAGRFVRSKLSPEASFLVDWFTEEQYFGQDFTLKDAVRQRVLPLSVKEFYEVAHEEGLFGMAKTIPTIVGIGVQTYPEKKKRRGKLRF